MKPIIDCIRTYLCGFPGLKDGLFGVDYLGAEATEYTVEAVPCDPVFRQYTDGGCMKQFLFLFGSREWYSADAAQNTENLGFYEEFERWIRKNNYDGILPDLDDREAYGIEVMTGGYVFDADTNTARYQMQLRLTYFDKEDYP